MTGRCKAESGLQLLSRLSARPSLLHLDDVLFPDGPKPGDVIQISGEVSVGKSMLLLKLLTKCLLPKEQESIQIGGLGAGVILIDTDHNISIIRLATFIEGIISNQMKKQGLF